MGRWGEPLSSHPAGHLPTPWCGVLEDSPGSDSSGRSGPRQVGRVDDISDALGVRLRDVLACERAVLETVGLAFLNRPAIGGPGAVIRLQK